ncbi:MAG: UDP-N-acetylmuramate dehydrogenase [Pseudomonadota bacterium]|nr:UDP-N-acetylenolpyruvoylglucosamine reductase [Gammaproteobacteria bacterium]MEC8858446.1 UDP-N-acetylmuramate dehydrogenase [Pseudomonadota bacterium]|tara:strand:+ start:1308 stop:2402 length:1095 start_codon:yes stop_codon:yes gene_type:complete
MSAPAHWRANADLAGLTTLALPARARWLVRVEQEDELPGVLAHASRMDLPVMVLGGGSNVLFARDYPGVVIVMDLMGVQACADGKDMLVTAAAGENWHQFVEYTLSRGWFGLENLALIPGRVGAAPVQNIGAYGVELAQRFHSLRYLDRDGGQVETLTAEQCEFAYRDSIFKNRLRDKAIILSCTFRLSQQFTPVLTYPALRNALQVAGLDSDNSSIAESHEEISAQQVFDAVCAVRRSKLPDPTVLGNAGSFFRNPVVNRQHYHELSQQWPQLPLFEIPGDPLHVKLPAAWLIEKAGWKGLRRGNIGVHDQQALVLVHDFRADAGPVQPGQALMELAAQIAQDVWQRFAVHLEPEVQIINGIS